MVFTDEQVRRKEKLIMAGQAYNLAVKTNPKGSKDELMSSTITHFQNLVELSEKLVPENASAPEKYPVKRPAGKIRCQVCGLNWHDEQWKQCFKCKEKADGEKGG